MIHFIICEDQLHIQKSIGEIVAKQLPNFVDYYKIMNFKEYNEEFEKIIKLNTQKIFLLDVKLKKANGFEIARKIRFYDSQSDIIFFTAYPSFKGDAFKYRLKILDYIVKHEDPHLTRLSESIAIAVANLVEPSKQQISFKVNSSIVNLALEDLIYIRRINSERKTYLYTKNECLKVNESLDSIEKKLDSHFYRTHRSCIINIDYVLRVDLHNELITLKDGAILPWLSRDRKKSFLNFFNTTLP
ncbi:MAG: LytR/AlgR family response regulator transcription factor [Eubacteriaceae bacterium]